MSDALNPEKALIFRITHVQNVRWILRNGLHCKNSRLADPRFVRIGNLELIQKREGRAVPVPPGGTLSDYVPFYFTPFSMMMYNIHTGFGGIRQFPNKDIAILVSSLHTLENAGHPTVFTDRHAYLKAAQFFASTEHLDQIDWDLLNKKDFRRDPDDPEKTDRYQAEALVHRHLPAASLRGIVCYDENTKRTLDRYAEETEVTLRIVTRPAWYFP